MYKLGCGIVGKRYLFILFASFLILILSIPSHPLSVAEEREKTVAPETSDSQPAVTADAEQTPEGGEDIGEEGVPDYEYEEPEFGENKVSYPLLILRTVAVLGALIVGIYLLFRLLLKNRNRIITDSEIIKVLATYPLAANRIIQVVDVAGQVLVLGVSDSSINLITEVEDQEVVDRIKLLSSKEKSAGASFKDQFFKLLGGKVFTNSPGQISNLSGYRKRINRFRKL